MVTETPDISPTSGYRASPPDLDIRAFRDQVLADYVGSGPAALVDVRSPEEYRGERLTPTTCPTRPRSGRVTFPAR